MKTFALTLTTPRDSLTREGLVFLDVPAADGRLTVLPDHQDLVCVLRDGELILRLANGIEERHAVGAGAMTVLANEVEIVSRQPTQD